MGASSEEAAVAAGCWALLLTSCVAVVCVVLCGCVERVNLCASVVLCVCLCCLAATTAT